MRLRTVKFRFDAGTKKVTADDVVRTIKLMLEATGDLADWEIQTLSLASPFDLAAGGTDDMVNPISAFTTSMMEIESGSKPSKPLGPTSNKLLDSVDAITSKHFGSVQIAPTAKLSVTMNHAAVQKARKATGQLAPSLMVHAREQIGQLRGDLEQITVKRGQSPRFGIRDRVSHVVVPCVIADGDDELLASAKKALGRRVIVSGLIRFGSQSVATSIKVASLEIPDEFTIPFDKLIRAPLTRDGDSVGHIRRLRNG